VADTRIHGTTRAQVGEVFRTAEKSALKPLPMDLFPAYSEVRRRVNRDSYIELGKAYYQTPAEHIGRDVWVRFDGRQVRIFDSKLQQIITHTKLDPGRYSQVRGVRGLDQGGGLDATMRYWQNRAELLGNASAAWAQAAITDRGAAALRSIMGLCQLHRKHSAESINAACQAAMEAHSSRGTAPLCSIQSRLLTPQPEQLQLLPLPPVQVRPLGHYEHFIRQQQDHPTHPHRHLA
jgi:hypothetical protein